MPVEALPWRVVPAVASTGHTLTKPKILDKRHELDAGVMAALIDVNQSIFLKRYTIIPLHNSDRFKNEINFQTVAEHMCQSFLGICIQYS